MWGVCDEESNSGELDGMGKGEVAPWEDGWVVGDEGSKLGELDGITPRNIP